MEAQRKALFDIRFVDNESRRKKVSTYTPVNKDALLSSPLIVSVDGVFAPQTNLFIKILINRLVEHPWIMSNQIIIQEQELSLEL